jgi:hypothetical protein
MAVTAKAFYNNIAQNSMLDGLVSHGFGDYDAITKIAAKATSGLGLGSFSETLTFGTPATGSVSITNTPVLNITASNTINYLQLMGLDTNLTDYVPYIIFTIDAEEFAYDGTITITGLTLSVSSTIS